MYPKIKLDTTAAPGLGLSFVYHPAMDWEYWPQLSFEVYFLKWILAFELHLTWLSKEKEHLERLKEKILADESKRLITQALEATTKAPKIAQAAPKKKKVDRPTSKIKGSAKTKQTKKKTTR